MAIIYVTMPVGVLQWGLAYGVSLPRKMAIDVTVDDVNVAKWAKSMQEKLLDLSKFLNDTSDVLLKGFDDNFSAGGRPPWAPPSPNTVFAKSLGSDTLLKRLHGKARKTRVAQLRQQAYKRSRQGLLVASGEYKRSWVNKSDASHISKIGKDFVEEGSSHFLVGIHETGSRPHKIRPKHASKLSFITTRGRVLADEVNHPGTPARPVGTISDRDVDKIVSMLQKHLEDFVV